MAYDTNDRPDATGIAHQRQAEAVTICRDVYGGTLRMREKEAEYLPRFPREAHDAYRDRLASAVLFNGFRRTTGGLVGLVFRKDPALSEDVPDELAGDAENIDLHGRSLAVFARDLFESALLDGHALIFVDRQRRDAGRVRTLADERAAGERPYWVALRKQDVLRFRTQNIGGKPVLTSFAYCEYVTEPVGEFGEREVERIRQYDLDQNAGQVGYLVFEKRDKTAGKAEWLIVEEGVMGIDRIPVAPAYTNRTGFLESEPPLLDLALENIKHYQVRSDHDHALHIASVPIPVFIGLDDSDTITWGPNHGIKLPQGADAKYLEPQGVALEAGREHLRDIEGRMAVLGLSMLVRETRSAETAEAKRIDKSETDSQLAAAARGLQNALAEALALHARWRGMDEGGSAEVNRDFQDETLEPAMVKELREMVASGQLSLDTMWDKLVQGEILLDSFDPELERSRIEQEMAALAPPGPTPVDDEAA